MSVSVELARFVAPLSSALSSPAGTATLLDELGVLDGPWTVAEVPGALVDLAAAAGEALAALDAIAADAELGGDEVVQAIEAVAGVLESVQALADLASEPLDEMAPPFDTAAGWTSLAAALPAYLLARWLRDFHPVAYASLRLVGAVERDERGGARVDFDALGAFVADPATHVLAVVGDDPSVLLPPIQAIAAALGGTPRSRPIVLDGQSASVGEDVERLPQPRCDIALVTPQLGENWSIDTSVEPVVAGGDPGLQVLATAAGQLGDTAVLSPEWTLVPGLAVGVAAGVVLTAGGPRPAEGNGADSASLTLAGAPLEPWVLLGSAGATRLELGSLTFAVEAEGLRGTPAVTARMLIEGLRLVVAPGEGDSFVAGLLGSAELAADAALTAAWSSTDGFSFGAGAGFDVVIPIERALGPVFFHALRIGIAADPAGLATELGASVSAWLGPVEVVVDDIGLRAVVSPAAEPGRGAFGDVDFTLGFKPPAGLGLGIDAGIVTGAGYLEHDPDSARYAGAGELGILGTGLSAVGVVTTEMPDGSEGWSMFLSLGARLVGVQLGFGFTLNGVGGLVGIDRGLDDDALGEAVRSGSLDAILFPDDPIGDAPRILADIDRVFPPVRGQYVFGPVVKIGWGTPTLIELDVGVAVQLPDPVTVSVLGALSSVLPTEDVPLLELHAEIAGTVNFTEGTLKVDASLSGSQVAGLQITGGMSVRCDFLGEPTFLLAFGGFHPAFDAPADFPVLDRVGVALDTGDDLRIGLGGYFALTSNTVQFGAAAELWAQEVGFTAEAGTSFDALIVFDPFGFDIGLKMWASISAGEIELMGVLLAGRLSGPNPWHAVGEAEFRLLGIKTRLEIEATFGTRTGEAPPSAVDVGALLHEAIARDDAWLALPPAGDGAVVLADAGPELAVHPAGRVQVVQRIVPLDRTIQRYGSAELAGEDLFGVVAVGFAAEDVEDVDDWFAAAQYFRLGEDEKLSSPSFATMKAGLALGGSGVDAPASRELTYDHEVVYRDPNGGGSERRGRRLSGSSATAVTRSLAPRGGGAAAVEFVVSEPSYVVAERDTGAAVAAPVDFFAARAGVTAERVLVPEYELELLP